MNNAAAQAPDQQRMCTVFTVHNDTAFHINMAPVHSPTGDLAAL